MLNNNQIKALSDAYLNSGPGKTGLVQQSGGTWKAESGYHDPGHSHNTVRALVNKGYLSLWASGTVAHITDSGIAALESFREKLEGRDAAVMDR